MLAQTDNLASWEGILERWGLAIVILALAIFALWYMYRNTVPKIVYDNLRLRHDEHTMAIENCLKEIAVNQNTYARGQNEIAEFMALATQSFATLTREIELVSMQQRLHHELMMEFRKMNGIKKEG